MFAFLIEPNQTEEHVLDLMFPNYLNIDNLSLEMIDFKIMEG